MFLEENEIIELTGKKIRRLQREALNYMQIEYKERPDGSVAVMREHVENVFSGQISAPKSFKTPEPNWDAI